MLGNRGILWNLVTILVNVILIIVIPTSYTLASIWSLQQIGIINSDIYAPVFTIVDVFTGSSDEFWFTYLDYSLALLVVGGMNVIFIITGILEFI